MKKLFTKYAWLQILLAVLLIGGGIAVIIIAANNKENVLADALCITTAVIFFIFGGIAILASFIVDYKKIVSLGIMYGSLSIACGILLCSYASHMDLLNYLVYVLSIFMIVFGAVELIKALVSTIIRQQSLFVLIMTYVVAVLFITGGILSLVFRADITTVFCIGAGVVLIVVGILLLILGVKILISANKKRPQQNDEPNDTRTNNGDDVIDYTKR